MNNYFDEEGLTITDDHTFMEKEHAITDDVSYWINRMHLDVAKKKNGTVDRLIELINKYPKNPQLKNLLTSYYISTNQEEKGYEFNRKTLAAHPNYFFAKLNLANEYVYNEEYDKVIEVLGENFDLKALYPNRSTFHISEVMSMLKFGSIYNAYIREFEKAKAFIERMRKIDPSDYEVEIAEKTLLQQTFLAIEERSSLEAENCIEVVTPTQIVTTKTEKPVFNHSEVERLYEYSFAIPNEIMEEILNLPRASLIEDLETVLNDSIERFSYFEENCYDYASTYFVIHAFNLLAELGATNQLQTVLKVLAQSKELVEFYLDLYLTEFVWITIYKLGDQNLEMLAQFMKHPGIYMFSKTEIAESVAQIALHQPERRNEVISWFQSVLETYKNASLDENLVDSEVIGLMVCDVLEIEGKELLPVIRDLFDLGYVNPGICGDFKTVEEILLHKEQKNKKVELLSYSEIYSKINRALELVENTPTKNWGESNYLSSDTYEPIQPFISEPKINRNDPCPCGSGKKYKKCCLK